MKPTFSQYLVEFRIPVPDTSMTQAMNIVASGYFSYIAQKIRSNGGKLGREFKSAVKDARSKYGDFQVFDFGDGDQNVSGTINYNTGELPERYRSGMKLKSSYPIKIDVGDHGEGKNGAAYYPMGRGSSGSIQVNLSTLPGINDATGSQDAILGDLEELENMMTHELQHATQDVVLRKKHPSQMALPGEDDGEDKYYTSDIEFQPQITTASGEFKRLLNAVKQKQEVTPEQAQALLKAFVMPNATMPQGFLRYKPQFQNKFFGSLYKNDPQKWKKAVKELHRLLSRASLTA